VQVHQSTQKQLKTAVDQIFPFCYNTCIVIKKEPEMQTATAIKQIQKDAEFLGLGFLEMMQFIKVNPMAQTQKTMEAYRVVMCEGARMFAPVDE
jgi:hypothetical protein